MKIQLHPSIVAALQEKTPDVEAIVNDILMVYCNEGFILRSDVAAMFVLTKIVRKSFQVGHPFYDEMTKEFKGVTVTGRKESDSLFIPNDKLHDMLQENQVLMVLKSPRMSGIRVESTEDILVVHDEAN